MLTLFTTCAPFKGHRKIIQTNALRSWTLLTPRPEILLFGDEEGTTEIAQELGIRHIPRVERNEYGTPLMSDLFAQAQRLASYPILCFANADIILTSSFLSAVQLVAERFQRFVMVGRRWDVDLSEPLDFAQPTWENDLRDRVLHSGRLHSWDGMDYFVFPRGLLDKIPPFTIGRLTWDNWLIYRARALRTPVVDATPMVFVVHQNHDYSHISAGRSRLLKGPEAQRNLRLAGGRLYLFTVADSTHVLTQKGIKKAFGPVYLWRKFYTLGVLYPGLMPLRRILDAFLHVTWPLRRQVNLTLTPSRKGKIGL